MDNALGDSGGRGFLVRSVAGAVTGLLVSLVFSGYAVVSTLLSGGRVLGGLTLGAVIFGYSSSGVCAGLFAGSLAPYRGNIFVALLIGVITSLTVYGSVALAVAGFDPNEVDIAGVLAMGGFIGLFAGVTIWRQARGETKSKALE